MINLFYAVLLCIVQFLPLPCLASKACDASIVDNVTYLEVPGDVGSRKSIDLWETGNNELVLSDGYITNYQELACSETWLKIEQTFGNVWSTFNEDYDTWRYNYAFNVGGLYMQVPVYFSSDSGYTNAYNYVTTNYSIYEVVTINLYNRIYSIWGFSSTQYCYIHTIDFKFSNGDYVEFLFYKSDAGANQCSYSLFGMHYVNNVSSTISLKDYSLFATNTFTLNNVFFVSDYWIITEEGQQRYDDGYQTGYNVGVEVGKTAGETTGYGEGYQDGYNEGLAHADYDSTALTIMQGIIDVGLLPVNVFLMMLNFEVFGVNISGFVSALLTISIVIIIVRFLFGGKSDD